MPEFKLSHNEEKEVDLARLQLEAVREEVVRTHWGINLPVLINQYPGTLTCLCCKMAVVSLASQSDASMSCASAMQLQ